ncbi:hypothetical protein QTP86_010142 [Hemibagrus guttatus]|nr:hypothetical protein QTP86_010142 [Hemibagrus guttatus]
MWRGLSGHALLAPSLGVWNKNYKTPPTLPINGRSKPYKVQNSTSSTTTLNTGAPQGCVLSPLLFTLLTHDCAAMHSSNHIIKFADDTTMVGLISKNEVQRLTAWCKDNNNLSLNMEITKEMVVDFRRAQSDHSPLNINGSNVKIMKSTKFLSVHLAEDLTWLLNTSSITRKAQQCLYFLRRLRKAHLPPLILTTFYRGSMESILSSCITAWFGNCTMSDRKTLQRIVRTTENIIGVSLPSILDIYSTHCIRKVNSIVDDPTHPSHTLFTHLPSGKKYRSIRAHTPRLLNSFFPQAISHGGVSISGVVYDAFIDVSKEVVELVWEKGTADFSSAFNTIIPQHLIEKLSLSGLNTSLCNWILDFLPGRPQSVWIGNSISSTTTLSTGAPQGCVLSPLLFALLTHDCAAMHSLNHIIKLADDTTVVGIINKNNESAYIEEVQRLTAWCRANSLFLNVYKTKEMVVDFTTAQSGHSPLFINGSSVEIVKRIKFLGVHLAENFT